MDYTRSCFLCLCLPSWPGSLEVQCTTFGLPTQNRGHRIIGRSASAVISDDLSFPISFLLHQSFYIVLFFPLYFLFFCHWLGHGLGNVTTSRSLGSRRSIRYVFNARSKASCRRSCSRYRAQKKEELDLMTNELVERRKENKWTTGVLTDWLIPLKNRIDHQERSRAPVVLNWKLSKDSPSTYVHSRMVSIN